MAGLPSSSSSSPSIMESLFQRSLEDMIKGLRVHPLGEPLFLSKCLEEARREARSTDHDTKTAALEKLAYARSVLGVDSSPWSDFHVVEAMSFPRYAHRRVGYLAASLSFSDSTEVLLLITNLLRKDLTGKSELDAALALEFLSVAATPDLARDLTPEVFTLLGSGKPYLKKKAIAVLVRLFDRYPDSVRVCFKRLVESLDASDVQVVSSAIGVFCELAAKDPRSYLPLAPEFYKVLVDSKNNWVLIKVVKIFASLAPLESRLGNKVVKPICEIMRKTGAKSLMFECIRAIVLSFSEHDDAVASAVEKIREMLLDEDPNLTYLGLQALLILMPKRLSAVLENKDAVVKSLEHGDPSIRRVALTLVMGMVSEDNLVEISRVLVSYAFKSDPEFCNEILGSILSTCSQNLYELVVDFDWYVSLLGEISRSPHCGHGEEIERQLIDIALRVKDARVELVRVCRDLLIDPALLGNPLMDRILSAAAWIAGEYVDLSKNPIELAEALLQPRANLVPPAVRAVYIQSVFKIFVFCLYSDFMQPESANELDSCNDGKISVKMKNLDKFAALSLSEESVDNKIEMDTVNSEDKLVPETSSAVLECMFEERFPVKLGGGEEVSSMAVTEKGIYSYNSILHLLNLIRASISPLVDIDHVDVQERARNVLGFINSLEEIPGFCVEENVSEDTFFVQKKEYKRAFELIELMYGIFLEELGPVSVYAQQRVQVPDGLVLKENLADLDGILGGDVSQLSSFADENRENREWDVHLFNLQKNEDKKPTDESSSLLSEHRKRHLMYYLPTEREPSESNDYPPANISQSLGHSSDAANDLAKLTEKSLISKMTNRSKPRPQVVKLDEGDEVRKPAARRGQGQLTSTVNNMQEGGRESSVSSHPVNDKAESSKFLNESTIKMDRSSTLLGETSLPEKEKYGRRAKHGDGNSSLKMDKSRSRDKDRHRDSSRHDKKDKESTKHSSKSDRHRTKHKNQQRSKSPISVDPKTTVIPDFLL
ncbi:AP-3 complex subunit delta [Nymphaea thermarum]|nr:AP-3 complex subunit delta [Nymphaea thermarum]